MWAQYKKTFLIVQLFIGIVAFEAYRATGNRWDVAALFVATMESCAVLGAMWSNRLKRKLGRRAW